MADRNNTGLRRRHDLDASPYSKCFSSDTAERRKKPYTNFDDYMSDSSISPFRNEILRKIKAPVKKESNESILLRNIQRQVKEVKLKSNEKQRLSINYSAHILDSANSIPEINLETKHNNKNSVYSDGEDNHLRHALNIQEDYSIKHFGDDESCKSGDSEFPSSKDCLNYKCIYSKDRFISCPEGIARQCKKFYQHDLDKLLLSEIYSKEIFNKACTVELTSNNVFPYDISSQDNKTDRIFSDGKPWRNLINTCIPRYNSPMVNRQCCPRFSVPLKGSLDITQEDIDSQTLLLFNSRFESGNLERAYKIKEIYKVPELSIRKSGMSKNHTSKIVGASKYRAATSQSKVKLEARYDLFLTPDSSFGNKPNKKGEFTKFKLTKHTQWFYYSTKNFAKDLRITFAIKNLYKKKSAYTKGMQPFVFSLKKHKETGIGWHRGGELIRYTQNFDKPEQYTLRFVYTYEYEDDIVYFAHFQPYTFTRLKCLLHKLKKYVKNQNQMQIFELCRTVSNIPCYCLKICNSLLADKNSKIIFLTCRVHPGESNSSFMLEGILKQLLSCNELKTKFVYYIIPILNPDGVYYGRYRCNMTGADLNRIWHIPSRYFHPTIFYTKELLKRLHNGDFFRSKDDLNRSTQNVKQEQKVLHIPNHDNSKTPNAKFKIKKNSIKISTKMKQSLHSKKISKTTVPDDLDEKIENVILFVDIHGHSIADSIFMYGCKGSNPAESSEIKEMPYLLASDLLSKAQEKLARPRKANLNCDACMISQCTSHNNIEYEARIFSKDGCKFVNEKSKENTGRVVVFKEIGVKNSYTLESSYFRACPETMKTANPDCVPPSSSIRYNNYLIDTRVIRIGEDNLIEFGKFFAYVTNHYLHYKKAHQSAKIIEILGEEEEKVRVDDNKIEAVSQPKIMSVKKNAGIESFANNKRQPKFSASNERTLPAVSASAMRNKMDRPGKRTFLKKIKAKNTNLRIFRGENEPKPTQTCNIIDISHTLNSNFKAQYKSIGHRANDEYIKDTMNKYNEVAPQMSLIKFLQRHRRFKDLQN
ncbi:unnamed protein product [Moneuplotes crassus]|uniref:Peptidase M14 domain-containing protein n=1 Tax=Euplotes crassus TaxID=5936 RepID=A0AAD1XFL3_EUPCR|nr:unnamed protein product [Moneuplotes crassus]